MTKYNLTTADLRQHLKEHVEWLQQSMHAYDSGKEHEAKRLAHTLRSLLHDTAASHSLLAQLGVKDSVRFWSMLPNFGSSPTTSFMGVRMELGSRDGAFSARYSAKLGSPEQRLPFDQWWHEEPLIVQDGQSVTRKRAILAVANKDGGSHVDPELNELEHKLLRTDVMGWKVVTIRGASHTVVKEEKVDLRGNDAVVRVTRSEGGKAESTPSDLKAQFMPLSGRLHTKCTVPYLSNLHPVWRDRSNPLATRLHIPLFRHHGRAAGFAEDIPLHVLAFAADHFAADESEVQRGPGTAWTDRNAPHDRKREGFSAGAYSQFSRRYRES